MQIQSMQYTLCRLSSVARILPFLLLDMVFFVGGCYFIFLAILALEFGSWTYAWNSKRKSLWNFTISVDLVIFVSKTHRMIGLFIPKLEKIILTYGLQCTNLWDPSWPKSKKNAKEMMKLIVQVHWQVLAHFCATSLGI